VHLSSPASIVSHAGGNLDAVALKHYQVSAAERLIANAGTGISLFAQSGGARFIAHQGPVGIQARHDDVTIEAARHLKLSASDGQLQALAAKEILLATADGCYLKLGNGRIELGCSGAIALKAARHDWSGPATQAAELPILPAPTWGAPRLRAADRRPADRRRPLRDHACRRPGGGRRHRRRGPRPVHHQRAVREPRRPLHAPET
jgi:type VI secretion system secreted protein VgrG